MAAGGSQDDGDALYSGLSFTEENPPIKLLFEEPLEKWNKHAEEFGFPKKDICKAKTYYDISSGHYLSPICPWIKVQHLRSDQAFTLTRRCCTHLTAYFYYGNLRVIHEMLFHASYKMVLPGTSNHICFVVAHLSRQPVGIIANEETAEFVGFFEFSLEGNPDSVMRLSHFAVSRDQSSMCLTLNLTKSSIRAYSVNLYVKSGVESGIIKYSLLRVMGFTEGLFLTHVALASLPSKQLSYVVLHRTRGPRNIKLHAASYDFHDNYEIQKTSNLCRYLSNETSLTAGFGVQNIMVSPDDSLLLICIEEMSEDRRTRVAHKLGKTIILNVATLTVLTCVTSHFECEYWWTLENFCCFSDITPDVSKSGYQMALTTVKPREPDDVDSLYANDKYATYVSVFQLPHVRTDLRSQCRKVIRQNIEYIPDISKLKLPDMLKDFIRFKQVL